MWEHVFKILGYTCTENLFNTVVYFHQCVGLEYMCRNCPNIYIHISVYIHI